MEKEAETRYVPDVQVTYYEDNVNVDSNSEDKVAQLIRLLSESETLEQNTCPKPLPIDTKWQTVKRQRRRCPVAIDDPRKFYADNAIAAMLSGDINHYREVLERQHIPDCIWIQRHTNDTPDHPAYREVRGRELIIEFVAALMEINPDMVIHISGRKLNVCEDGSSYLVSKGTYCAMNVSSFKFTNMVQRTRKYMSSINPLGALRSYFYGGGLHTVNAADPSTESAEQDEETAANKSKRNKFKSSSIITSNDHRSDSPPESSSSTSSPNISATESNSLVSTPETKIVIVYDKEHTPSGINAVVSTVAFINPEFKIYKIESFVKVEITPFGRPWNFGLSAQASKK